MDTEAIASEIVEIRNRLDEMEGQDAVDSDVGERESLEVRIRFLRGKLSADGVDATGEQTEPEKIHYLPPA